METPMDKIIKAQWGYLDQYLRLMSVGIDMFQYVQRRQAEFIHDRYGMRLRDVIPNGADWFDCYGKRGHDINVERV